MSGKDERNRREKSLKPKAVRKRTLYGVEGEEGAPMPPLKVPSGVNIPTQNYRGVLGLSFRPQNRRR